METGFKPTDRRRAARTYPASSIARAGLQRRYRHEITEYRRELEFLGGLHHRYLRIHKRQGHLPIFVSTRKLGPRRSRNGVPNRRALAQRDD